MGVRGSNAWQQAKEVAHSGVWLLLGCLLATPVAVAVTITGEVRRAAPPDTPVPDARVTVFDASLSFFREARTDASGAYTIPSVPDGAYQIGCAAIDLEYIEEAISVAGGVLQRDFTLGPETHPGVWSIVGDTSPEILDATDIAVLLPTGEIFYCHDTVDPILFDPVTATKSFPSGSAQPSGCMNGSLLPDGTVLFAGGQNGSDPGDFVLAVPWVKTFLPTSDAWQQLADLQHSPGRWYPGMARLADGSFLVMGGGQCCDAARTDTAERFDLETQTWSYTGSMINPSEFSPSALLYTGEVLITWSPPQLYNPVSEEWPVDGQLQPARARLARAQRSLDHRARRRPGPRRGHPERCDRQLGHG